MYTQHSQHIKHFQQTASSTSEINCFQGYMTAPLRFDAALPGFTLFQRLPVIPLQQLHYCNYCTHTIEYIPPPATLPPPPTPPTLSSSLTASRNSYSKSDSSSEMAIQNICARMVSLSSWADESWSCLSDWALRDRSRFVFLGQSSGHGDGHGTSTGDER